METKFNFLTKEEEAELTSSELKQYYVAMKEYYNSLPLNSIRIKMQELIHPLLLLGVTALYSRKTEIFGKDNLPDKNENCIYAFNHSNGNDFPMAASVVKNHFHILADFTMKNDFWVDFANRLNGCVYVDRLNKEDRKKSKDELLKLLFAGKNIFIFPEGTWNLSPNLLMLPLNWGIIDLARISGVPIVPCIIDYGDNKNYVNVGKKLYVDPKDTKEQKILELTDSFATLRWQLMEKREKLIRAKLPDDYCDQMIKKELETYKKLNKEYEESVILKKQSSPDEVFEPIRKLQLNKNNAFLANRNYGK